MIYGIDCDRWLVIQAPILDPKAVTVNGKSVPQISGNGDGRSLGWYHGNGTGLFEGTLLVVGTGELSAAATVTVQVHRA